MRWALLSLGLLGAILYVTGTLTPSPEPSGSSESAALIWPDDAQLDTRPGLPIHAIDPSAPSPQKASPIITRQVPATSQTSETQEPLLNDPAAPSAALPSDHPEQHSWGQLVRVAPVHSGPSVSSAILGHAAAGTEMQLLERNLGWARIRDPGTSREGWIYEEHITLKAGPSAGEQAGGRHEAALDSEELEQPKRSFKAKKSQKNYAKKRWRKPLRFVLRFRRF
jgi:Bacterial SH3 domain